MTITKPSARENRRDTLYGFAVMNPDGFTVDDVMAAHGWSHKQTNQAIHDLRGWLGDFDTINLPCDPQGPRERWLYRLVGDWDDVRVWRRNRVKDADARLRTMQAVMVSIVNATDGRSVEGRRARTMERGLRHLVEDLDALA